MRYMTLAEMLEGLRIETHNSTNVAHGAAFDSAHKYLLNRVQDDLYLNYDWPGLKAVWELSAANGERYHAYPDNARFETIDAIYAKDGANRWIKLTYGITPEQLSITNSDDNERGFPICRWQSYMQPSGPTNNNMFEVWPVPDRTVPLMVKGLRACRPLVNSDDVSTIDGYAVVLHAASELLAGSKSEDAPIKLQKAQERVRMLKVRQASKDNRPLSLSRSGSTPHLRPGLDYIPSGGF